MDLAISHYNLESLFSKCSEKNLLTEAEKIQIDTRTFQDIWIAFIKWVKSSLDVERTIQISGFGSISYRQLEAKDSPKIQMIFLNENFINTHHLKYRGEIDTSPNPPIKINYSGISKILGEVNKSVVKAAIDSIFYEINEIVGQRKNCEIDLGSLGKLSVYEKTITYEPFLFQSKISQKANKQTVRTLIDARKGLTQSQVQGPGVSQSLAQLKPKHLKELDQFYLENNISQEPYSSNLGKQSNLVMQSMQDPLLNQSSMPIMKKTFRVVNKSSSMAKFLSQDKQVSSPTRRFQQNEVTIDPDLLSAGTDPLAKKQDFSRLASNAMSLMSAYFIKPPYADIRFPPILDKFSRTLAAPLSSQKFNLSISARIGSNYTSSARTLHFDNESKGVQMLPVPYQSVNFTANKELLQQIGTLEEELDYVVNEKRSPELELKIKSKRACYQRYRSYIENEIPVEYIAPINNLWISEFLDLIPHQLSHVDRYKMEAMINAMLNEVNKDYKDSVKKSILDYVLKDEEEKMRIGIVDVFDKIDDYGCNIYQGIEPDDEWKEHVNVARDEIGQNLVVNSKATLKLMSLWKKYEKMYFLVLPSKKDQTMTIQNFLQIQVKNITEVKNHLISEWHKDVIDIYQEELPAMSKNKKHAVLFFESNATLMSNQIRTLVRDSLQQYQTFCRRFRTDRVIEPAQIVEGEKNCRNPIQDVFLHVKLQAESGKILFSDDLEQNIKKDCLKIIDDIVLTTKGFPRPENTKARSEKNTLWDIPMDDEVYVEVKTEIEEILTVNIRNCAKVTSIYEKYVYLLQEKERIETWVTVVRKREEFNKMIQKYKVLYDEVNSEVPFYVRTNMILVDGVDTKKKFLSIIQEILKTLQFAIYQYILGRNQEIYKQIVELQDKIKDKAEDTSKLVILEGLLETTKKTENRRILTEFKDLISWISCVYDTFQELTDENLRSIHQTSLLVHNLMNFVDQEENRIMKERDELENRLKKIRDDFEQNLNDLYQKVDVLHATFTTVYAKDEAVKTIEAYGYTITEYMTEMQEINKKEEQLGWTTTEFPKLVEGQQNLKPYDDLWTLIKEESEKSDQYKRVKSVFLLDPEEIEKEVKQMISTAQKVKIYFTKTKAQNQPQKLAENVLNNLKEFQKHIPLIRVFSNRGLKERHWDEISQIVHFKVNPERREVLNRFIGLELTKESYDRLEEISDTASKEFGIEKILDKMKQDWEPILVELKSWKDTGTYVVAGASVDEVQQILDDQIVKTLTMKGSPYARIFEDRIFEWESWLNYTLNLFEYWVKVQNVWLYLEPVFTSPDITKHLPQEAQDFKKVDTDWRSAIMGKVSKEPKVLDFTKERRMLEILKDSHLRLEKVQKGLNSYLEGKRSNFPRFYFLSNDELLEILSETKDPLRVQPHLKKCFEGIQKLKFDPEKKILGMYSSEEEYVPFLQEVDTAAARGNVDEWLLWVEDRMIKCVQKVHQDGFYDFVKYDRAKWVLGRCGMAVLCINMTYWTSNSEKALNDEGNAGVSKYAKVCASQLESIVELVRSNINSLDRCTIEALIVLDVHNRDCIAQLAKNGVEKVQDFDWQAQLRYYWENNDTVVRIINAVAQYNYEYLGNSARLVITPLTDRCYRTLCGAIHLNYGGAPEGPAGTGKTETVKDLAKALSRQCVVFNCSDGLDFKAMGKFFKGLSSSGAWSCFDEFNRIDLEVLSVVAQQILTIQLAQAEKKKEFFFEDAMIKLKPTCNCFITMNPGYAGRSELPDNLKALFRSVAMMVPDYAMIAEISLYSFGFNDARNLARKIVTTYKLCSEQLSSQDHYDYGMRAVKSVLTAAGNLKRKFGDQNESILMLRAINDVNLAKFLAYDLPLFKGITSDLFPGVKLPEIDYKNMHECIDMKIKDLKLQKVEYFIEKTIQLYEMILVRHGLMVVGMPFSGKTSALNVLAGALTYLNERGQMGENRVQIIRVNPKSITMQQLYGYSDEISHEWTDGVLAVKFRQFAKGEDPDRKWLIFDGPVDAVWIENMNTVLDDNKKLCLNSGEIIAMSRSMNMIFEPMDLAAASPATVSRCGMIYMEPASMGWKPLYQSWLQELPQTFTQVEIDEIDLLFNWVIDPSLKYLRHSCKEISPTQDQNLVISLMKMYRGLLKDLDKPETFNALDVKQRLNILDQRFVFSFIWSVGGSVITQDRKTFDIYIKRLLNKDIAMPEEVKTKKISLPDRGLLYDYVFETRSNKPDGDWFLWTDLIVVEEIPPKKKVQEIMVQTADTVRYSYILKHNILLEHPSLFCGPTGTGKSVYIKNLIMNGLPNSQYMTIEVGFSAQTSATQTQDILDGRLDRKRKGIYGPKTGKCIIFVDDLNMPTKEKYGAQPSIEILRQMTDQGGWYDFRDKEKPFKQLVDIIFVSAMGPPGGGRTFITPRFLRHLNLISIANFDDEALNRIFGTILHWYFGVNGFSQDCVKLENKLIHASLEVYKMAVSELLPTPMKSHYLFNLRDFAKVIFGVCMGDKDRISNQEVLVRLWAHECWRVFADRLTNEADRILMLHALRDIVKKTYALNFDTVFEAIKDPSKKDQSINTLDEIRRLIFTDVLTPLGVPKRPYEEITDQLKLQRACEEYLENYNTISDKPMDLVLFSFAIEHLLIIERILKQPAGNALLVGVGGSGRQSLTRLASAMVDFDVFQIEISKTYGKIEWHDDIKKILRSAGGKNKPTIFLFTDSQIKQEGFVEDINNLLNTCQVPNLFAPDEKADLMELVRADARTDGKSAEGTPDQLYAFFVERSKANLHIVLAFSPIGDAFRNRVRMFPSLVNCCTIDWFFEWPQDALVSVAKKFLEKVEMEPEIKRSCTEMVQIFHESTIQWANKFFAQLKRKYYVTPTSYLEMIITFQSLLSEKRKEIQIKIDKYENGYNQIIQTEQSVGQMQIELTDMVPKLKQATEDTEKKVVIVAEEKKEADVLAEGIQAEEAVVKKIVDDANEIKEDCERDLAEAMPALQAAEEALNCIEKKDIDFLKQMRTPVEAIKATMKAVCLILYPNPQEKKKEGLKTVVDWWAASVKLLQNPKLLSEMKNYDKDAMEERLVQSLGAYMNDPEVKDNLERATVAKASPVCESMLLWAKAMYDFYFVNKKVKPKKAALAEAEAKANKFNAQLAVKQAELKKATDKVEALNKDLKQTQDKKEKLEARYEECSKQLIRAKQLIESLGGEKGRWGELAKELKAFYVCLTGDVLVSSGLLAYLGAFTPTYRTQISESWVQICKEKKIPSSEKFSLYQVLGDPVKIRAWNIDGLPSDAFSVENAIIIFKSRRWPLCIDPQGQANKWIKRMEAQRKIYIIKLTDSDYLRTLENAIQFGKPVLLENVGEDLDPSLTPILLKQTFLKGNTMYIKLGESTIEYQEDFRFYITTKLRNPHYLPELSTKVTILNFMITYEGLNDQLLGILVKKERPDLEREKERLIIEGANNKKQLAEIEDKILQVLSGNKNILTDESAINILTASKETSNVIKEKQAIAEKTEMDIDIARQTYQPVSTQASCLFFLVSDLGNLDPMYQYSLVYYIDLFTQGIINADQSDVFETRLDNLKTYFLYSLYSNICRSLFEKDKLVFSTLLTQRLMEFNQELDKDHWRFLLTGGIALSDQLPEQPQNASWLTLKMWGEMTRLSNLNEFQNFYKHLYEPPVLAQFKQLYDSNEPHTIPLPGQLEKKYSGFKKLLILRTIRPDKLIPAVQDFISLKLSKKFIEPPPFDLGLIYKDSNCSSPLIFVLSPGSDPFASLNAYSIKMNKQIKSISLGQGQGPIAQRMIVEGQEKGLWIVLQNCHLAVTWMNTLEKICEEIDPQKTNQDFRLWLTSYPSESFPTAILQAGIKMTNEPPKGLKNNLQGSYLIDPIAKVEFFEGCKQPPNFKILLYGLCFFHAVIQERRKYGPLGWNISYEFNESDLRICVLQLKMFLDEFETTIPFDALKYLTAECNYGGRVTDDKDRRLIVTLLEDYYCDQAVSNPLYRFGLNQVYQVPRYETHEEYLQYIRETLPLITPPDVFGFHANADITKDMNETQQLMNSLLICSSEGGEGGGASLEGTLNTLCDQILGDFPMPFNIEAISEVFPVVYTESMNTVLTQELTRFNKLINVVRSSLNDIKKALKGLILLSAQLEKASKSLFDGKVPDLWMESSYPSLKPLGGYVQNLRQRLQFFQTWVDSGTPQMFWLSGFYFTQSFLTGVLQNYARRYTIPIDEIEFDFQFLKDDPQGKPDDGAYVWGLFIEGSKWNYEIMELDESDPKILFVKCPVIQLVPSQTKMLKKYSHYNCPVYKTSARRGVLSTTGHSTNFVMWIRLPSSKQQRHWIKRGVALLTQLDD